MDGTKKDTKTVVQDIYAYLESPEKEGYLDDKDVDELAKEIALVLKKRAAERRNPNFTLRLSNYGKPPRQLWFEANSPLSRQKPRGSLLIKFLYGDIIEAMLLFLVRQSGHSVTKEQDSVVLEGIDGHIDAVVNGDTVIDVKSASKWAFAKKFKGGAVLNKVDDSFGYVPQLKGYQKSLDLPNAGLLSACKETGELWYLPLEGDYPDNFDAKATMNHAKKVLEMDAPPVEKCYPDQPDGESGNRVLNRNCEWCSHKFECWGSQLRAFDYASGTKYFTRVAKRPQAHIPEVTEVLRSQSIGDSDEA
jgi:hypothetical protein